MQLLDTEGQELNPGLFDLQSFQHQLLPFLPSNNMEENLFMNEAKSKDSKRKTHIWGEKSVSASLCRNVYSKSFLYANSTESKLCYLQK